MAEAKNVPVLPERESPSSVVSPSARATPSFRLDPLIFLTYRGGGGTSTYGRFFRFFFTTTTDESVSMASPSSRSVEYRLRDRGGLPASSSTKPSSSVSGGGGAEDRSAVREAGGDGRNRGNPPSARLWSSVGEGDLSFSEVGGPATGATFTVSASGGEICSVSARNEGGEAIRMSPA